jgi:outer membrane receptor protein involved in Fe transport
MLDVNFSAAFFSDQNNFGAGETRTPGYTTFHFSAATREFDLYYSHLHFSAGIDNITDKLYRDHLSTLRGLIKNEPGRNVYVKMQINW